MFETTARALWSRLYKPMFSDVEEYDKA